MQCSQESITLANLFFAFFEIGLTEIMVSIRGTFVRNYETMLEQRERTGCLTLTVCNVVKRGESDPPRIISDGGLFQLLCATCISNGRTNANILENLIIGEQITEKLSIAFGCSESIGFLRIALISNNNISIVYSDRLNSTGLINSEGTMHRSDCSCHDVCCVCTDNNLQDGGWIVNPLND